MSKNEDSFFSVLTYLEWAPTTLLGPREDLVHIPPKEWKLKAKEFSIVFARLMLRLWAEHRGNCMVGNNCDIKCVECSEMSLYSLVAFSTENKMVAFAAFDDNPMATIPPSFPQELSEKAGRWAVQTALDLGYRVCRCFLALFHFPLSFRFFPISTPPAKCHFQVPIRHSSVTCPKSVFTCTLPIKCFFVDKAKDPFLPMGDWSFHGIMECIL